MKEAKTRNSGIELLRVILMFGICMCHSVGAGGHIWVPLRNVCMMCTVGFIFITGWFGIHFSLKRIAKLLGIALFALGVVCLEDLCVNGELTENPAKRMFQWWFLNAYVALIILSPILNSIVACLVSTDAKLRREAFMSVVLICCSIYAIAWPMHCHWMPRIGFFLTIGCPCQFGTICAIYLAARTIRACGVIDRIHFAIPAICLVCSIGLAMYSHKFSYYNSPMDLLFSASLFYFFYKRELNSNKVRSFVYLVAPSMFFVYLYHSHGNPGFEILRLFQTWLVDNGMPVPLGWIITAIVIFVIGVALDFIRRIGITCMVTFNARVHDRAVT